MNRSLEEIEEELDELQEAYVEEEDEVKRRQIERRFDLCLDEATELDGILRVAAGVTIVNWTKED